MFLNNIAKSIKNNGINKSPKDEKNSMGDLY